METSNSRSQVAGQQQQQPRRSLFRRVWTTVLRFFCIKAVIDQSTVATQTDADYHQQSGSAGNAAAQQPENVSTRQSPTAAKLASSSSLSGSSRKFSESSSRSSSRSFSESSSSSSSTVPSSVSYGEAIMIPATSNLSPGEVISTGSSTPSSLSPGEIIRIPATSNLSPGEVILPTYFASKVSSSSSSLSPGQIIRMPITSNLSPGEVILPTYFASRLPSISPGEIVARLPSSSSDTLSSSSQITSPPTPAGNGDTASQHLSEMLPPVQILDPSSVTALVNPVQLGYGSFGRVDLMSSSISYGHNNFVAVKTAFMKSYKDPEDAWNQMIMEARAMEFLSDLPSIPRIFGVFREGDNCSMVQEFIGNSLNLSSTTFLDVLQTGKPALSGIECISMTSEIAKTLGEMHRRGILHNDVAARNILIHHDGARFRAKLTDFGMVSCIQDPKRSQQMTFTSDAERDQYLGEHPEVAPEKILQGALDSVKGDIYSLGYGIKIIGMGTGNNNMLQLGEACTQLNPDDRPTLDRVIITLANIEESESRNPVCRPINRPLF